MSTAPSSTNDSFCLSPNDLWQDVYAGGIQEGSCTAHKAIGAPHACSVMHGPDRLHAGTMQHALTGPVVESAKQSKMGGLSLKACCHGAPT